MLQISKYFAQQILSALTAHVTAGDFSGILYGAKVVLFKNNIQPAIDTLLASLTIADFTGYATSGAIVFGAVLNDPSGGLSFYAPGVQFTATDGVTPNTIYGYAVIDSGGTHLLWSETFNTPVQVNVAGQGLFVVPNLRLPADGWGSAPVLQ